MRNVVKAISAVLLIAAAFCANALPPRYDHVVIVVEENHSQANIIGNADAPYMNSLVVTGASFTNMYGLIHPSQPNYLELFAGSTHGWVSNEIPVNSQGQTTDVSPFNTPNLGAAIHNAGFTFGGYSQGLPEVGSQVAAADAYRRKHNPVANWQDNAWTDYSTARANPLPNSLPRSVNMPFTSFPTDFSKLPTVSLVVPDQNNDMHDGTIAQADTWLQTNLDPYVQWAKTHNSLLILTWDEDSFAAGNNNHIPTMFAGARVATNAKVAQTYTLHNVLRTVEDMYGLSHSGNGADVKPIVGAFTTDPAVTRITFRQGASSYTGARDTHLREGAPTTAYAAAASLSVDADYDTAVAGSQRSQSLVAFTNIVAGAGGTIPTDATILSAKLTLCTTGIVTDPVEVHRMISPWTGTSTWNSLAGGVSANDTEAAILSDFTYAPPLVNNTAHFDVTDTVQKWVEGSAPNNGWVILTNSDDGYTFISSEGATAAQRPTLDVAYALYPRFSAAAGSWNTAANWAHGTPNAAGAVARFLTRPAASTITLDGNRTVGTLLLDSPTAYTLNPGAGGSLALSNFGNAAAVQVKQGQHTLNVPLIFTDPGSFDVAANAKVTATAGVTVAAFQLLTKTGPGMAKITNNLTLAAGTTADVRAGELQVDHITGQGALHVRAGATARLTATNGQASTITALTFDGSPNAWAGTVDLGHAAVVINYSGATPLATVADQIKVAHASNWAGPGLTSAAAVVDPTTAVGIAEASVLLSLTGAQTATFMGQTVDATSLLVRFTKSGDATLNGTVDFNDLVQLAQNYNTAPGPGAWLKGDFTYDGFVDFNDLVALAQNYNTALAGEAVPVAIAADFAAALAAARVPEPSTCAAVAVSAIVCALRRSRRVRIW